MRRPWAATISGDRVPAKEGKRTLHMPSLRPRQVPSGRAVSVLGLSRPYRATASLYSGGTGLCVFCIPRLADNVARCKECEYMSQREQAHLHTPGPCLARSDLTAQCVCLA